jgi:tRNA threonylcarbamoyladenosine biosynthesis protein TsaE
MSSDTIAIQTRSADETREVGRTVGQLLRPGDTVLLSGDLGAGKTTLVQGIAAAHGVVEPVTSPTFTLIHEYHGLKNLIVHVDPYRLSGPEELEGIGYFDYLDQDVILVVEWPERLGDVAPADAVRVLITYAGDAQRTIDFQWSNPRLKDLAIKLEALA